MTDIRQHIRSVLVVALLASAVFAAFLYGSFRKDESGVLVLVLAKSATTAPARDIAENLVALSGTDAYYSIFHARIAEKYAGEMRYLTREERSARFDPRVSVGILPSGSVLTVSVPSDDPEEGESIAREAALSLFFHAGRYYNVRTEADFRIIGSAPVMTGTVDVFPYVAVSLLSGILFSLFVFLIVFGYRDVVDAFREARREMPMFDTRIFEPKRPSPSILEETVPESAGTEPSGNMFEEELREARKEAFASVVPTGTGEFASESAPTVTGERKGMAPMNLPELTDAEERFFDEFSFETGTEDGYKEESDSEDGLGGEEWHDEAVAETEGSASSVETAREPESPREPTKEEYRRRLNELLGQ